MGSDFPGSLDPVDQGGGAESGQERHEFDPRLGGLKGRALTGVEFLEGVIARLAIDVGAKGRNFSREPGRAEDHDGIDACERPERVSALRLVLNGARGAFERTDALVGIQRDDQRVALSAGLAKVEKVPGVEEIEHPIGENNLAAGGAESVAPRDGIGKREQFGVVELHWLASLTASPAVVNPAFAMIPRVPLALILIACTATLFAAKDKPVIGLSLDTLKEERWQRDRDTFIAEAEKRGAKVIVQSANSDDVRQVRDVESLLSRGVDVLVIVPHNGEAMTRAVKSANEAKVPVISYDRLILNAAIDYYLSFDNIKVGETQA